MTSWKDILERLSTVEFGLLHVLYKPVQTVKLCEYKRYKNTRDYIADCRLQITLQIVAGVFTSFV